MLYLVTPTFNRHAVFLNFVHELREQTFQGYVLVAVDHGTEKVKCSDDKVIIIEGSSDKWWTGAINIGLRYVLSLPSIKPEDHILVINDDVIINNDYLEQVNKAIAQKPNSCIGSLCYQTIPPYKIQHLNMKLNKAKACFIYEHHGEILDTLKANFYDSDVLKGRGTVFPVGILNEIGLYNEEKLPHYRADHELAWRAKKHGYEVVVSKNMQIGAKLDSPHKMRKDLGFIANYKNIFCHIVSTENLKDLWNYSFASFSFAYAFYYWFVNFARQHVVFVLNYIKTKR